MVPADAELILEGRIDAPSPIEEGLVSEYHGMYEQTARASSRPSRPDPAQRCDLQAIEPGYHRACLSRRAADRASLLSAISAVMPNVRMSPSPRRCRAHRHRVQIADVRPGGQARRAMFAAFAAVRPGEARHRRRSDIDPWDAVAVEWARVNRMKLERDLLLVPQAGTDRSEPMEEGGLVTKAGFDATAKSADRLEGVDRALPPAAFRDAARRWFTENLPAHQRPWLR